MKFLSKIHNIMHAALQNEPLEYLKFAIYGVKSGDEVRGKDQAFRYLFAGLEQGKDGKVKKAVEFIEKALKVFKAMKDEQGEHFCYYFRAELEEADQELDQAIMYYQKAYDYLNTQGHRMALGIEEKLKELRR